jgi:hypothetical protein
MWEGGTPLLFTVLESPEDSENDDMKEVLLFLFFPHEFHYFRRSCLMSPEKKGCIFNSIFLLTFCLDLFERASIEKKTLDKGN